MMNTDGLLEIVGRTKDIISRGGTKIYPKVVWFTIITIRNFILYMKYII